VSARPRWLCIGRSADRFPDGQLYVNLRGFASAAPLAPLDAVTGLVGALGVPADRVPNDVNDASSMYRSLMAGKRILLVLDNAASAEQVRPLLPGSSEAGVLVTSRYQLRGLIARDGARTLDLGVLSQDEAVALLSRLLGAERAEAERAAVVKLAEMCGWLPLALRIAAANLASRPPQPVEDHVALLRADDRLAALSVTGDPDSAVLVSFDLSYRGLPAATQRMFRLLGLVPGPDVVAETAATVAEVGVDEAQRQLDLLTDAHLLQEHSYGRYTFHDLLRRYAASRADREETASDRAAAQRRLYDFYLSTVDAAARLLYPEKARLTVDWAPRASERSTGAVPPEQRPATGRQFDDRKQASAWLDDELPNLVAAVSAAEHLGLRSMAWLLADALRGSFWLNRSIVNWLAVGQTALAAAQADGERAAEAAAWLSAMPGS
jgi:hypothetical protein